MRGGIVIELSRLCGIGDPAAAAADGRITVGAGALLGRVDQEVRAHGAELPVVTTTYAASHAAGWVAGGHVGLGSSSWGTIWDGNIVGATVMTCEAHPRLLTLDEGSVEPVLHAYGTTGIITDVTFRLVPARSWVEMVVAFPRFDGAARFVVDLSEQTEGIRVAAAQEPLLTPAFTALAGDAADDEALVMTIAAADRGRRGQRPGRGPRGSSNPVERSGRVPPAHARLHGLRPPHAVGEEAVRLGRLPALLPAGGPARRPAPRHQGPVRRSLCLVELKYIRSRWLRERWGQSGDGVIFAPLVGMVNGRDDLDALLTFCDDIGVAYQNPHTFFLDEQGLFADPGLLHRFKQEVDPKGLLNPGKLSGDPAARMAEGVR